MQKCARCEGNLAAVYVCLGCLTPYCNAACQLDHWYEHKHVCSRIGLTFDAATKTLTAPLIGARQGGDEFMIEYNTEYPDELKLIEQANALLLLFEEIVERVDEKWMLDGVLLRVSYSTLGGPGTMTFTARKLECKPSIFGKTPLKGVDFIIHLGNSENRLLLYTFEQLNKLLGDGFIQKDDRLSLLRTFIAYINALIGYLGPLDGELTTLTLRMEGLLGEYWYNETGTYSLKTGDQNAWHNSRLNFEFQVNPSLITRWLANFTYTDRKEDMLREQIEAIREIETLKTTVPWFIQLSNELFRGKSFSDVAIRVQSPVVPKDSTEEASDEISESL